MFNFCTIGRVHMFFFCLISFSVHAWCSSNLYLDIYDHCMYVCFLYSCFIKYVEVTTEFVLISVISGFVNCF
jgi:hypothetical protein